MKKLLFLGLLAFVISAIALLPLSFAKPYIEKFNPEIALNQVSGTIWKGEVSHLTVKNIYYGKVNWAIQPTPSLISLSLKGNFNINGKNLSANGLASLTPAKKLILTETDFNIDAVFVNRLQKNAAITGDFQGKLSSAELKVKQLPVINGIIDWKNGSVTSPIKIERGDYRAVLRPVSEGLDIGLSSSDSPIELNGNIKLQNDWKFETNLIAKGNNPSIKAMLNLAGKPQSDGSTVIQQNGDLTPYLGL